MHSPGVTVRPLRQMTGEEDFNEIFFEDVRVPRANAVGAVHGGWPIAVTTLMHERQTLTFSRQLQSRVALNALLAFARRHPIDAPASRRPLLRQQLAAAYIDSAVMRHTALRNLTRVLRGGEPGPEGSIEKLFWSEMYQRMLDTAVKITGPFAQLAPGSPAAVANGQWSHLMLYSRGRTIAAGTSEIQRNIIAERLLGLPRVR
jgi:alkylation response protein AidB-like acyl-CoA dehydrogenase